MVCQESLTLCAMKNIKLLDLYLTCPVCPANYELNTFEQVIGSFKALVSLAVMLSV